jgi:type IV pilus assembly protein PilA
MQQRKKQHGFTLIELMIVVAIIGILAAIAMPQYQDYVTRSRWSDNVQAVGHLKIAIAECLQNNNSDMSVCDTMAELTGSGYLNSGFTMPTPKYATIQMGLTPGTAALVITGNVQASNCVVTLTPSTAVGTALVTWVYTNSGPAGCNRTRTGVGT